MPQPGDHRAARRAGRSQLRASHADRDQVVDALKDAFVTVGADVDTRVDRPSRRDRLRFLGRCHHASLPLH